jgi:hypothetical protein
MAKSIDEPTTGRRPDRYLDLDTNLIRKPNPLPMLRRSPPAKPRIRISA